MVRFWCPLFNLLLVLGHEEILRHKPLLHLAFVQMYCVDFVHKFEFSVTFLPENTDNMSSYYLVKHIYFANFLKTVFL